MTVRKSNEHNWTYLPELGPDWSYCECCGKCYRGSEEDKKYTYRQALAIIESEPPSAPPVAS